MKAGEGVMLTRVLTFLATLGYLLSSLPLDVQASGNSVLHTMKPEFVYELTIQADDGADYHQYAYVSETLGFCDVSRPAAIRECHVNPSAIARMFRHMTVVRSEPALPPSVQWAGWDWQTMTLKEGGYTPVILSAEFNEWDAENEQTRHWWLACSILPDNDKLAACKEVNYIAPPSNQIINVDLAVQAQIQYFTIRADGLLAIHQSVFGDPALQTANSNTGTGLGEVVDSMYG
jgi:hypothetical protein